MKRTITIAALALTSALVLSACADNTEGENTDTTTIATTSAPDTTETTGATTDPETETGAAGEVSAEHNDADIMFAQMMIPHHQQAVEDRKSTRLNSSHVAISYAVFCLKKKTHTKIHPI